MQAPASKLVGSPSAQAEPVALDAPRESALPEDPPAPLQQPREQAVPGTGPGASDGGLLAAPQILVPPAQASQVLQAAENLPKAPARTPEQPRAPASPLAVGRMTQVRQSAALGVNSDMLLSNACLPSCPSLLSRALSCKRPCHHSSWVQNKALLLHRAPARARDTAPALRAQARLSGGPGARLRPGWRRHRPAGMTRQRQRAPSTASPPSWCIMRASCSLARARHVFICIHRNFN